MPFGLLVERNAVTRELALRSVPTGFDFPTPVALERNGAVLGTAQPLWHRLRPDGRHFATEHGIDERNARHVIGDHEDFYEIIEGAWYGWPDFASRVRLGDPYWGDGGRGREPVLAEHPDRNGTCQGR